MTSVKKFNSLVLETFAEHVEDPSSVWMVDTVQKALKRLLTSQTSKPKDPNAPKRGKSAYLFFCADNRDKVRKELGDEAKATEVTVRLGQLWNDLKASSKAADKKLIQQYQTLSDTDKERYETEKASYVPPSEEELAVPKRRGRKSEGPKRAKTGYIFFCAEYRNKVHESDPELKATEITTRLGQMWRELKEDPSRADEYARYEQMANEDRARYQAEKDGETSTKSEPKKAAPKKTTGKGKGKGQGKGKGKGPGKGKTNTSNEVTETVVKSNGGGYQAFVASRRPVLSKKFPKSKSAEITKKIGAEWKALSAEEKAKWSE